MTSIRTETISIGIQPRSGLPPPSAVSMTSPPAAVSQPSTWNQNASRRRPNASTNTPMTTSTAPTTSAATVRSSPLGDSSRHGTNSCDPTITAPIATARRNGKPVSANAISPTSAVAADTPTQYALNSVKGRKNGSFVQPPINFRNDTETAEQA